MTDTSLSTMAAGVGAQKRVVGHIRTATDAWHLLGFLALLALGLLLALAADETMEGIEADLTEAFDRLPQDLELLIIGTAQIAMLLVMIGVPIGLVLAGRRRILALGALAAGVAVAVMIALERSFLFGIPPDAKSPAETFLFDEGWPPATALAGYSAAAAVVTPSLPRRWRPPAWIVLAVLAVLRFVTGTSAPANIPIAIALGGVVGTLVLLTFGRPLRINTPAAVMRSLRTARVPVETVGDAQDEEMPARYPATLLDGTRASVKVISPDDWQSDRLQRTFRRLRLRGIGSAIPSESPRRAAAVEAMLIHAARDRGARAPRVIALTAVTDEDVALATEQIECASMAGLSDYHVTDDLLIDCWQQVAAFRAARIAHGNLQLANVHVSVAGHVWVTGFEYGEPAAAEELLASDVVELLVGTSLRVGPERAVAAAISVLGPDVVSGSMARMVPAVLTRPTRHALREDRGHIKRLVTEISRITGVEAPQPVQLERFPPRTLIMTGLLAAAIYVLAPQVSNLPDMFQAMANVDVAWLPAVALASLLTYVGSAVAVIGGTPGRVPFPLSWMVAFAASFVATVAPPGVGNVALTVRFLQQRGFPASVAVTASVAKETAVFVVHILLLLLCAVWVGRSGVLAEQLAVLQPGGWVLLLVGAVAISVGVALSFRRVRRVIQRTVIPAVRRSVEAMEHVVRSPSKLLALFSGAAMLPIGYAVCLYASVQAFDGGSTFPAIAFVSLTAMTVASAAPTPGGIGAVEAALLTALTAIGVPSVEALASVFLFRIATFWLPIIPGVVSFRVLSARQII